MYKSCGVTFDFVQTLVKKCDSYLNAMVQQSRCLCHYDVKKLS